MAEAPVAVLTGGCQGLGAAFCTVLLENGYKVCVSDIQEEKGEQFVKEQQQKYGADNVRFVVCDVTKEEDYENLFEFAMNEFKKIDLVLNNAGIDSEQEAKKVVEINLIGPIIGCRLALKYMGKNNGKNGGMVINTASMAGFLPFHLAPVYSATKHGVIGLTRSYGTAYQFKGDNVLFTAICPFLVDTDMLRRHHTNFTKNFNAYKKYETMTPEYVAQGILKLLEDKINGSTLLVTEKGYNYIGYQEELKDILAI